MNQSMLGSPIKYPHIPRAAIPSILRWGLLALAWYTLWKREFFILILSTVSLSVSLLAHGFVRMYPKVSAWDLVVTSLLFFHTFLGVALGFYESVPFYDKALHFTWSAFIGFSIWKTLVYCSKERGRPDLKQFGILLVILLDFSLGGLWEILEFLVDRFVILPRPAQIDLCDTMCDSIANLAGALFAGGMLWIDIKKQALKELLTNLDSEERPFRK
jgi:hypothetical protein